MAVQQVDKLVDCWAAHLANAWDLPDWQGVDKAVYGGVIAADCKLPVRLAHVCGNLGQEPVRADAAGAGQLGLLPYPTPDLLRHCLTCRAHLPVKELEYLKSPEAHLLAHLMTSQAFPRPLNAVMAEND